MNPKGHRKNSRLRCFKLVTALVLAIWPLLTVPSAWGTGTAGQDTLSVVAGGDIMLANWLTPILDKEGPSYPFAHVADLLSKAQLRIFNLEAPFGEDGTPFDKRFTFRVPVRHKAVLQEGGINAVNLANNHILDYGPPALQTTLVVLDSLGIHHFGAGLNDRCACEPVFVRFGNLRVALLGYSLTYPKAFYAGPEKPGTCYGAADRVAQAVQSAVDSGAVVIVSFHWGTELRETPRRYQRDLAHAAIDAGATLVLGHHPHVLQGLEVYRGKLIAYSLGNFIFASYSNQARDSGLLLVEISERRPIRAHFVPLNVWNKRVAFQPRVARGRHAEQILRHLDALSRPLNNGHSIIASNGAIRLTPENLSARSTRFKPLAASGASP